MKRNMGSADRVLRILAALVVAILVFTNVISGTLAVILMVFAVIFLITSFIGLCPLYSLLGFSTCKNQVKTT